MQSMRHYLAKALALFGALLLTTPAASAAQFPKLNQSRVVDDAKILAPAEETALADKIAKIETETGNQLAVATVASLQGMEIEDYGLMLGRRWKIGLAGADNGLMIIVAPKNRKTRIEVGIGLEDRITNAVADDVVQTAMVPRFKEGDFATGIGDAIDMIAARFTEDQPLSPSGTLPLVDGELVSEPSASSPQPSAPEMTQGEAMFVLAMVFVLAVGVFALFFAALSKLAGAGRRVTSWNSARSSVYVHNSPSFFSSSSSPSSSSRSSFSSGGGGGRFRGSGASGSW